MAEHSQFPPKHTQRPATAAGGGRHNTRSISSLLKVTDATPRRQSQPTLMPKTESTSANVLSQSQVNRRRSSERRNRGGNGGSTGVILYAKKMNDQILKEKEAKAQRLLAEEEVKRAEIYAINAFMREVFEAKLKKYVQMRQDKEQKGDHVEVEGTVTQTQDKGKEDSDAEGPSSSSSSSIALQQHLHGV